MALPGLGGRDAGRDLRLEVTSTTPLVALEVCRVDRAVWDLFKHHHYRDTSLHASAKCFVAFWCGRPVAFASAIHSPGKVSVWREHRTVCLPDSQGVGIGNALSEFVAGVMKCLKGRYLSTTGNPAMIRHRAQSPLWRMVRKPSKVNRDRGELSRRVGVGKTRAVDRLTAGFEYVGRRDQRMAGDWVSVLLLDRRRKVGRIARPVPLVPHETPGLPNSPPQDGQLTSNPASGKGTHDRHPQRPK